MQVARLDHLVLTCADLDATVRWYEIVLGMRHEVFGEGRHALVFGGQKINLHQQGAEFEPKAATPMPGSADLCFVGSVPLTQTVEHLRSVGCPVEQGPVSRTGALGPMTSVYVRDPDANLVEIGHYDRA